jgi:hypothetical protein
MNIEVFDTGDSAVEEAAKIISKAAATAIVSPGIKCQQFSRF